MAYSYAGNTPPSTSYGGKYREVSVTVTPDAATGNVTIAEITTIDRVIGAVFDGGTDLSANAATVQVAIDGTTVNKLNFKLWNASGNAATAYPTFTVTVRGY